MDYSFHIPTVPQWFLDENYDGYDCVAMSIEGNHLFPFLLHTYLPLIWVDPKSRTRFSLLYLSHPTSLPSFTLRPPPTRIRRQTVRFPEKLENINPQPKSGH